MLRTAVSQTGVWGYNKHDSQRDVLILAHFVLTMGLTTANHEHNHSNR